MYDRNEYALEQLQQTEMHCVTTLQLGMLSLHQPPGARSLCLWWRYRMNNIARGVNLQPK